MNICFESVFNENNLEQALETLLAKKNTCGSDGIFVNQFEEYWKLNGEKILLNIKEGVYQPSFVQEKEIVMANGKRRRVVVCTCTDRVILRSLSNILQEKLNPIFSENSFAYRQNMGMVDAVGKAAAYIQSGKGWVVELDIADFFEHIDLSRMLKLLEPLFDDERMMELLKKYLYCTVERDHLLYDKTRGLFQGYSVSPVLSNLYLNELDWWLESRGVSFCRFADNINVYVEEREQALEWYSKITAMLENKFSLSVNAQKSGVFPAINRRFLGYQFFMDKCGNHVLVKKAKQKPSVNYHNWYRSALQRYDKDYHIINNGILTKKDYTVLFENDDGKKYLPVETMGNLNIYSDVIFSTGFFEFISSHDLKVSIYNKYGNFLGTFCSAKHSLSANLILKQVSIYNDEKQRLALAKSLLIGAVHNMRANLRYYHKKSNKFNMEIEQFSNYIDEINACSTLEILMLVEARCRQQYYKCMSKMIDVEEFAFSGRNKRPPKDPVNAMISFGNVFLYERISTEITKASLDVRIGILHATNYRNASLNLDIAEIFKPVIVDRVIFTMIHKKIINACDHFEQFEKDGVYLNSEGKHIFISALQKKLNSKLTVKGREVTYDTLIRNEVQKIYRRVKHDEQYEPYKYY